MKILAITLCIAVVLLATAVQGKGSFGYTRSTGGGYYRPTKRGYYSSRTRYYTAGMYWTPTYRSRYRGDNTGRTTSSGDASNDLPDILCKRELTTDASTYPSASITLNNTMKCIKELYAIPGDPGNQPYEQLMLNRLKYDLTLSPYPSVYLSVFPDKDVPDTLFEAGLRITRLFVAGTNGTYLATLPLSGLTWRPCSLTECPQSNGAASTFGYPSSRFLDGGRVTSIGIAANLSTTASIEIRFWLSGDFNEDTERDHVLLLPSVIKVDVKLVGDLCSVMTAGFPCGAGNEIGVETIVIVPATGEGSQLTTVDAKVTTSYNPRSMNRVEIGSTVDQRAGKAGVFAWSQSTRPEVALCRTQRGDNCAFAQASRTSLAAITNNVACTIGTESAPDCAGILRNAVGQKGLRIPFVLGSTSDGSNRSTYFQLGYWDPNEGSIPGRASASRVMTIISMLVVVVLALL